VHTSQSALEALERSTRTFLDLVADVPDARWRLRPAGQEWSMAETVEHVVLANRSVLGALGRALAAPLADGAERLDDAAISAAMFRSAGPAPPGAGEPTGCYATRAEGVAALAAARDAIAAWANDTALDLRAHGLAHPVFGTFDGIQWILFAAAHTDNHVPQLCALREATRGT